MAVVSKRVAGRAVEMVTTNGNGNGHRPSILDESGAPLGVFWFDPDDRSAASLLIALLRCATGSLRYDGRYDFVADRGQWRTLRDVSAELLLHEVRRVERSWPDWALPGDAADAIHSRVEAFFESARR